MKNEASNKIKTNLIAIRIKIEQYYFYIKVHVLKNFHVPIKSKEH